MTLLLILSWVEQQEEVGGELVVDELQTILVVIEALLQRLCWLPSHSQMDIGCGFWAEQTSSADVMDT
ncbi:unnamed protein product [Boreogadus saida]